MNFDPNRDDELENSEEDRFLEEEENTEAADDAAEAVDEPVEDDVADEDEIVEDDMVEPEGMMPAPGFVDGGMPEGPPPSNFDLAYPQLFFFLFASLAIAVGTLLPWERTYLKGNLTGADSIGGGLLLVLALYGIISGFFNIYHRKMIVWPVMLAGIEGAILGWQRVVQILGKIDASQFKTAEKEWQQFIQVVKGYVQSMGPGLYLVTIFSSLILLSIVLSVFKGAKEEGRRKAQEREMRAEARRGRKS